MSKKQKLLSKLFAHPIPKDFKMNELDRLMRECGCDKFPGGRGSGLRYFHIKTQRSLTFDGPHPGNELYIDHIKRVRNFLKEVGETD